MTLFASGENKYDRRIEIGGWKGRQLTLKAEFALSSRRHLTADRHRLDAAMCRAVPKSKSLQVASISAGRNKGGISGGFLEHAEFFFFCLFYISNQQRRLIVSAGEKNCGFL